MSSASYYNGSNPQQQPPAYPPPAGAPDHAVQPDQQRAWSGDKANQSTMPQDHQRAYGGQPPMQQYGHQPTMQQPYGAQPPMNPYQMQQGNAYGGQPANYGPPQANPNVYVMGNTPPGPMNNQHHQSSGGGGMGFFGTCCAVFAGCCCADLLCDLC